MKISYLLLLLVAATLLMLAFLVYKPRSSVPVVMNQDSSQPEVFMLERRMQYSWMDEGRALTYRDSSGAVKNLFSSHPFRHQYRNRLFLRVSLMHCQACLDSMFVLLGMDSAYWAQRLVMLGSFAEARQRRAWRDRHPAFPLLDLGRSQLQLQSEEANQPYFFRLSASGEIQHLFLPIKEYRSLTEAYLRNMQYHLNRKQ